MKDRKDFVTSGFVESAGVQTVRKFMSFLDYRNPHDVKVNVPSTYLAPVELQLHFKKKAQADILIFIKPFTELVARSIPKHISHMKTLRDIIFGVLMGIGCMNKRKNLPAPKRTFAVFGKHELRGVVLTKGSKNQVFLELVDGDDGDCKSLAHKIYDTCDLVQKTWLSGLSDLAISLKLP